jgi:hypothetical protein
LLLLVGLFIYVHIRNELGGGVNPVPYYLVDSGELPT